MRILVIKEFSKWAKGCDLTDSLLCDAVDEIERGLIDADLGGYLFKKRKSKRHFKREKDVTRIRKVLPMSH